MSNKNKNVGVGNFSIVDFLTLAGKFFIVGSGEGSFPGKVIESAEECYRKLMIELVPDPDDTDDGWVIAELRNSNNWRNDEHGDPYWWTIEVGEISSLHVIRIDRSGEAIKPPGHGRAYYCENCKDTHPEGVHCPLADPVASARQIGELQRLLIDAQEREAIALTLVREVREICVESLAAREQPPGEGNAKQIIACGCDGVCKKDTLPEGARCTLGEVSTSAKSSIVFTDQHVEYVQLYGGACRDCADENGTCPTSGLPCKESEKAVRHVLGAIEYGVNRGFVSDPR